MRKAFRVRCGYIFFNEVNDFTIVYKMKLYCEQQYKRSIIQSSLSIGSLLGLLVMNVVSDFKGRKFALLMDLCIAVTSSLRKLMVI